VLIFCLFADFNRTYKEILIRTKSADVLFSNIKVPFPWDFSGSFVGFFWFFCGIFLVIFANRTESLRVYVGSQ